MQIKTIGHEDSLTWMSLSKEYDDYVREASPDLTEWYDGNDVSPSFEDYRKSKISKKEALMAVNDDGDCCGIIAISRNNNNITFFGVFHKYDVMIVGDYLLSHAISELDASKIIKITEIKSQSEQIQKHNALFTKFGFTYQGDVMESGVSVKCMARIPTGN